MTGSIAIVIPVRNDTQTLALLLERSMTWPSEPAEIIVVASHADPLLDSLSARFGCKILHGPSSRGAQLDLGARTATADVLWFLHADAIPPAKGLAAIATSIDEGAESGCFRFQFQGPVTWYKRLLERLIAMRVRLGGIAYGDQGLFMKRSTYDACGGFPAQPLFEEVRLLKCLRRRGTFRVLAEALEVSTRRWDRDGWLKRSAHNRWLALEYTLGVSAERLASSYHRTDRTTAPNNS